MKRLLPWFILGFFLIYVVEAFFRPSRSPEGFNLGEFGRLPVLMNGRVQPIDSVGRNSLLQIRNTAAVPLEEKRAWQFWKHPRKLKATEWLLEVWMKPDLADQRPVFLIHHPELLGELKLDAQKGSGLNYYSFKQIEPNLDDIERQARRASQLEAKQRSSAESELLKLQNAIVIYQRLKNSLQPNTALQRDAGGKPVEYDFAAAVARFQTNLPAGVSAARAQEQGKEFDQAAYQAVLRFVQPFDIVSRAALPLIIPPADPSKARDGWENIGASVLGSLRTQVVNPAVAHFAAMSSAFAKGQPQEFDRSVAAYRQWMADKGLQPELSKGSNEFLYNQFQPFVKGLAIYLVAFIFGCSYWFSRSTVLYRSSTLLIGLAFVLHTGGLLYRMILEGRPPVTNLYSSAIFVGWGAVVLGMAIEWLYRNGIGTVTAAFVGLVTQLIAHNLAVGGDTMEMMRAVLDSNFWLATHVIVITLGYSAMFVAGVIAICYLLLGVLTPWLSAETAKALDRQVYGIVCFATLFNFVGTVLGGIWADQSWGRFWGWDPKENGALLIVLWSAIHLHVRWGRLANEQTQMALAVGGNIVTSFSWFGVNMLGVGLHSYGFMDSAFKWLMLFIASQLAIIGLAFIPRRLWVSSKSAPVMSLASSVDSQNASKPRSGRPPGQTPAGV